jgi:hypothetical protein
MDVGRIENTDESGVLLHSSCFARGVAVLESTQCSPLP